MGGRQKLERIQLAVVWVIVSGTGIQNKSGYGDRYANAFAPVSKAVCPLCSKAESQRTAVKASNIDFVTCDSPAINVALQPFSLKHTQVAFFFLKKNHWI